MSADAEFVCLFAYYHSQVYTYALEIQNQAQYKLRFTSTIDIIKGPIPLIFQLNSVNPKGFNLKNLDYP